MVSKERTCLIEVEGKCGKHRPFLSREVADSPQYLWNMLTLVSLGSSTVDIRRISLVSLTTKAYRMIDDLYRELPDWCYHGNGSVLNEFYGKDGLGPTYQGDEVRDVEAMSGRPIIG